MGANLKTAVLGATGYSGFELTRILLRHSRLEKPLLFGRVSGVGSRTGVSDPQKDLAEAFPALRGNGGYPMEPFSLEALQRADVDLLFLATPHELSRSLAPEVVGAGIRVVDLSGAWRLCCEKHRAVYGFHDSDAEVARQTSESAVYGLPELHAEEIAKAELVANPGCYATSVILAFGSAGKGWVGGSQPGRDFRFQVGRFGSREGSDGAHALCFSGRQPFCLRRVQASAPGRDGRAVGTGG